MEVLIGIVGVFGALWLLFRLCRSTATKRLLAVGGIRRALSNKSQKADYIGMATIGNVQFDNIVRARLDDDGIVLSFKKEDAEVLLPLELVAVTGNKWTCPLKFGTGEKAVGMNLGSAVSCEAIEKMKEKAASNQQIQPIAGKPGSG